MTRDPQRGRRLHPARALGLARAADRSLLARIRALPAWRADALLAGVLLAEAIAELFLSAKDDGSRLAAGQAGG